MAEATMSTEKDLARLKYLSSSHIAKSKFFQDFSHIIKERIIIQESYVKEITRFSKQMEALTTKGAINNILITLKAAYQQKLLAEQNFLGLLKKEMLETMDEALKKQNAEFQAVMSEKKSLEKEHKQYYEKTEMSQKKYFLHGRDKDAVGLEIECLNLRRKQGEPRQQKVTEKEKIAHALICRYNNMKKIWLHSESEYRVNVGEYNFFLERFGAGIRKAYVQLRNNEADKIQIVKEITKKILNGEPGLAAPSQEVEKLKGILEGINPKHELQESLKQVDTTQNFSLRLELTPYESFLQRELRELENNNEKEEECVKSFRKYYEDVLERNVPAETSLFVLPPNFAASEEQQREIQQKVNFVARLVDIAWRGQQVLKEDVKNLHMMLGDKFIRRIFTAAVQQYRLTGRFVLCEEGFKNTMKILVHFLYACFKIKDATNILKIMILSLTFWKLDPQKNNEKVFLHSKIVWHPIWRDLDFWPTSIYLSIREELLFQKKSLEEIESPTESADREKNVVFSQLLSFSHNMVTFLLDKTETKKILEKFCYYYDLGNEMIKTLINNVDTMARQHEQTLLMDKMKKEQEGSKAIKMSLISNYFASKKSAPSSEASDSKSTSDNQMGCEASKMMEQFRIEFEDDNMFQDVYGTNKGFSYGGELANSLEKMIKSDLSYGSDMGMGKLDSSSESEGRKLTASWFKSNEQPPL